MGLGKDLQGMANKVEATSNKGRAGLGLGDTHPLTLSTTPDYTPRPDTAILTHDHAALSFEEMEWWRIMEQRMPAKLLRSKFLPQDDILLAMRTAREMSRSWLSGQADVSDDKVPNQAMVGSMVSSAEGGWVSPLLVQSDSASLSADAVLSQSPRAVPNSLGSGPNSPGAASYSPSAFCLHQAPCVAPQGVQHSSSFWNMASLDSAFKICSSLAAMQHSGGSVDAGICLLDLSMDDCGATEYVLTHGGVRVQSAQVLPGETAEKLQSSVSNATGVVQTLSPGTIAGTDGSAMQAASVASTQLSDSTLALTDLPAASTLQATVGLSKAAAVLTGGGKQPSDCAAAEPVDVALLADSPAAKQQEVSATLKAHTADSAANPSDATDADVTDSTHVQTASPNAVRDQHSMAAQLSVSMPAAYSLQSYEAMKASLKGAHLVIGSLGSLNGQGPVPIGRETPQAKGRGDGQCAEDDGQDMPTAQGRGTQQAGVMEAEYADGYRARLLWECATALSCLQAGTAFMTGCVFAQHNEAHSNDGHCCCCMLLPRLHTSDT